MNVILKRIICFVLSAVIVAGCVVAGSILCNHPSEEVENTVSSFYREPENSLDVVMVGSSAASKDFQPSVIWKNANITSYCYSVGACSANIYTSILKEVLSKQPNAIILVDIDGFTVKEKFQSDTYPIQMYADSMPKNENRKEVINKYLSENKVERYFPFLYYHRNITSIGAYLPTTVRLLKKEIGNVRDPFGGATTNADITYPGPLFTSEKDATEPLTETGQIVFREFIDFCQKNNLKNIVFVNFPKTTYLDEDIERNITYSRRTNYIRNATKNLGYKVLDYGALNNPAQLDGYKDFTDTLHLNTSGAIKYSEYLAKYLSENYSFEKKNSDIISDWNYRSEICYESFKK